MGYSGGLALRAGAGMGVAAFNSGNTKVWGLAGAVPTLGKRKQGPGQLVVIGWRKRRGDLPWDVQEVLTWDGRNRRAHDIQQQVKFDFAHRALFVGTRSVSEASCSSVELLIQIESIPKIARGLVTEGLKAAKLESGLSSETPI